MTTAEALAWAREWACSPPVADVVNLHLAHLRASLSGGGSIEPFIIKFMTPEPEPVEVEDSLRGFFNINQRAEP